MALPESSAIYHAVTYLKAAADADHRCRACARLLPEIAGHGREPARIVSEIARRLLVDGSLPRCFVNIVGVRWPRAQEERIYSSIGWSPHHRRIEGKRSAVLCDGRTSTPADDRIEIRDPVKVSERRN